MSTIGALPPTPRQQEAIAWLWEGLPMAQIARRMGVHPQTVKSDLSAAYRRLGLDGRAAGQSTLAAVWLWRACRRECERRAGRR